MKCYLCNKELTEENSSKEHIIPNALGGKLTAKILCKKCNNDFGSLYDSCLATSLEWFSCKVNHSRSYGSVQPAQVRIEGHNVLSLPGGGFEGISCEKVQEGQYTIYAVGENANKNAQRKALEIITKAAKKHNWSEEQKNNNLEKYYAKIDTLLSQTEHPVVQFNVQFGGKETCLSLLKTAINFAIMHQIDKEYLTQAILILKAHNDENYKMCTNLFYPNNVFPSDCIYHTLFLVGDAHIKKLYCLISFYGVLNAIVVLSENYTGEDIYRSYCYDIWNEKEIFISPLVHLTKEQFDNALSISDDNWKAMANGMEKAIGNFLNFFVLEDNFTEKFVNLVFKLTDKIVLENVLLGQETFLEILKDNLISSKSEVLGNKIIKDQNILTILKGEHKNLFYNYYVNRKGIVEVLNLCTNIVIKSLFTPEYPTLLIGDNMIKKLKENIEYSYSESSLYQSMKNFVSDENNIRPFLDGVVIPLMKQYSYLHQQYNK